MQEALLLGYLMILLTEVQAQCQSNTKCECLLAGSSVKSASSFLSPVFSVSQSALGNVFNSTTSNGTETILNGGSWQPSAADVSPYFIIDFGVDKTVRKIITKGNGHYNYWIKEYNVYKKASVEPNYTLYKKLPGNTDENSAKQNSLNPLFSARYVKIVPLTFNNNVSLRIDIEGCDKVDGGWTSWEAWRKCRRPCGGSFQYRYRKCENPKPNFLGVNCPGGIYDQQGCNNHMCPDSDMTLTLQLPSEIWNEDLLVSPSTNQLCMNLQSNLTEVYKPANIDPFLLVVDCVFFPINITKVGVHTNLTFNTTDAMYVLKLQDGLFYHQIIHKMPAVFRSFQSSRVPNAPDILSYVSEKWNEFKVQRIASAIGPSTTGFEMFHRLETTNPDGAWSFRNQEMPTGSCDFSASWCHAWGVQAFHNYTVRIIPFNEEGFGFATDPYRLTTKENNPQTPSNLNGVMDSSTSINITWFVVPLIAMNGNSEGYQVAYKPRNGGNQEITILNHWQNQLQINGLEEYVEYKIKIRSKNTLFWSGYSSNIFIRTDQDIPSSPPISVGISVINSTALIISWDYVPEADKNGIIINYKINVSLGLLSTLTDSFLITISDGLARDAVISNLTKWSYYTMKIAASTIKGTSNYSSNVTIRTAQDRPSAAPRNLRGNATSSTAIDLFWDLIPLLSRHGVLTQYHIHYYPIFDPGNTGNEYFNGENTLQGSLSGLLYWTDYNIDIAARTNVGYGPRSAKIVVRTQEHAPTQPPESLRGMNTSSYSLRIEWDDVTAPFRHGVILGYTIKYKGIEDSLWQTVVNNGEGNKSSEIFGLKNYTLYDVKVAAFNVKGNGPEAAIQVKTEEARPSQPPSSLVSYNTSSSSLWVEWTEVPSVSQRGIILGYFIVYHDIVYNTTRNLTVFGDKVLSYNIIGLDEFREYRISVAGLNKMGIGPFISSNAITDEDIPSAAPTKISGSLVSSSELKISWSKPPNQDQNGQLVAINVFYKIDVRTAPTRAVDGFQYFQSFKSSNKTTNSSASRRRRSLSLSEQGWFCGMVDNTNEKQRIPLSANRYYDSAEESNALYNVMNYATSRNTESEQNQMIFSEELRRRSRRDASNLPGYSNVVLNANESSVSLNSLNPYMNYTIVIQASTIKGAGPLSDPILVQTGQDVPSAPPLNISTAFTSSTSIAVSWLPVPSENANGIVYAYIVSIKRTNSTDGWINYIQYEPKLNYEITGLMKFVVYSIKISAMTIKGSGPFSTVVYQQTDEDIPSEPPAKISGDAISPTALLIKWESVPENGEPSCCIHGILTGYKVWYGKRYPQPGDIVKTQVVPANQLSLNILSLETFSSYTIDVAAMTVKGPGPNSRVHTWTMELRPVLAPQNETLRNKTSTSLLIEWNELPFLQRKGEIRGYAIYYKVTKSNHPLSVKWLDMYHFTENYTVIYRPPVQVEYEDVIRRLWYELKGLYKFMEYTVHLTAYTKIGTGPWTYAKYSMTDEDVPSEAANNLTGYSINSSAIIVNWTPIRIVYDPSIKDPVCCVHGNLSGYTIFYTRVTKEEVHNKSLDLSYFESNEILRVNITNSTISTNQSNATATTMMHYTLTGLDSHKNYTIYVAGNTRKGHGALGTPIYVQTDQDVPAREPSAIRAWNISSTSLSVEWDEIVWEYRNGIILYYTVYYRETVKPWQEERSFNVSAEFNSTVIRNLKKWTFYDIRVYGATVKGQGLKSANVTVRTDTDVPTMPPLVFTAVDYTGPYSLLLKWKPIHVEHRHGDILSYKIIYFKYSEADVVQRKKIIFVRIIPTDQFQVYLEYLSTFCTYEIKILGMTDKGDGVASQPIRARTCRCVKHLYTNWWLLPPYTMETGINGRKPLNSTISDLSYVPMGLFPKFLRDMAVWGCENCNGPRGHGYSVVHFDMDRNGEKSLKKSKSDCMKVADEFLDFTFPVQGDFFQYKFISDGRFLPLIDHPSSALITVKKTKTISKSIAVKSAIFKLWPIFLINLLFAVISGFFLWFLDHEANPEELPKSFLKGIIHGIWWAYVTMTTVGYGDVTPRSMYAKTFAIIWMLAGLVLFAILGGGLTSALTAKEQVIMQHVKLYDNKVAVVNGSFEERLAMLKSAKPIAKKSSKEVLEMIKQEKIEAGLVDTFVLSLENEYFDDGSFLFVQKILKSSSFNFGVGLYGNITKLVNVFTDFLHSNQQQLIAAMVQYVSVKEKSESKAVLINGGSESSSLFQESSPIYRQTITVLSATIGVFIVFGTIFTCFMIKKTSRNNKLENELENRRRSCKSFSYCEKVFEEYDMIWNNFAQSMETKLKNLDQKHKEQHQWLIHLHRFIERCEGNGLDPDISLKRHRVSIKHWGKVAKERELLKIESQRINGTKMMLGMRNKRKISDEIQLIAKKKSFDSLSDKNMTNKMYINTNTNSSQHLIDSSNA